ncbi:MAG: 2'-5' RNA ligase family protein [bacterium]|nr:2'-5' RNA ligase family protein [bacterium]
MAEFVLAHILDEVEVGDRFTMWPLHVTLLPPFQADNANEVLENIKPITDSTLPIFAQAGELAQFGTKIFVRKIVINPELQALHNKILQLAQNLGWQTSGKYVGSYYTPHITRKSGRDFEGNEFVIKDLHIVEALPQGYRRIIAKLLLGTGQGVQ